MDNGVPHQPFRGSDVEEWIKRSRDRYTKWSQYNAIDRLLTEYREKADYGLRLDEEGGDP